MFRPWTWVASPQHEKNAHRLTRQLEQSTTGLLPDVKDEGERCHDDSRQSHNWEVFVTVGWACRRPSLLNQGAPITGSR